MVALHVPAMVHVGPSAVVLTPRQMMLAQDRKGAHHPHLTSSQINNLEAWHQNASDASKYARFGVGKDGWLDTIRC
jgi:hypothetical protein